MTDFVNLPLDKLRNRENPITRIENLEKGRIGARPSARVIQLGQVGDQTGNLVVDGSIKVLNRTDGVADLTIDEDGLWARNQQAAFGFEDTSGNRFTMYMFSDANDNLGFINFNLGKGFWFYSYDSTGGAASIFVDAAGFTLYDGGVTVVQDNVTVTAGNFVVSAGYDLYYSSQPLHEGWYPTTDTATQVSAYVFTVPGDRTSMFRKGAKFACTNSTSKYGVVGSSAYVTTDDATTINLIPNTDYSLTTDAITVPQVSYIENPISFPQWFNFNANPQGFSAVPSSPNYRWTTKANTIFIAYVEPNDGTSNATTFTASAPIAPTYNVTGVAGTLVNNGALLTVAGRIVMTASSTTITFRTDMANGAWTGGSTGKRAVAYFFYEF